MSSQKIEDLLKAYENGGKNLELELRFKNIDKETFISIYKNIKNADKFSFIGIETSINTITNNILGRRNKKNINYLRQQIFDGTKKTNDAYYKKTQVLMPIFVNDHLNYSINLSEELLIDSFTIPNDALVRIKRRAMFRYDIWRFDLTQIKAQKLNLIGPSLSLIKNELFSKKDFLGINFDYISEYSIEIEHIASKRIPTAADLGVAKMLFSFGDEQFISKLSYNDDLLVLAKLLVKNSERLKNFKNISLKRVTNQVIELNKTLYKNIFPPIDYFITEKADGLRTVILIQNGRGVIINGTSSKEFIAEGIDKLIVVDSEAIFPNDESKSEYLVFDIMYLDGKDLTGCPFKERLDNLQDGVKIINKFIPAISKKFIHIGAQEELKTAISAVYDVKKYKYKIDGIIMTAPNDNYFNTKSYKWKPIEDLTIDFLAKKVPSVMLGKIPFIAQPKHELYVLFVGISADMFTSSGLTLISKYDLFFGKRMSSYFPIQFAPSSNPHAYLYQHKTASKMGDIDGKIIELNFISGHWDFVKIREDRKAGGIYFGNDFKVAESTFQNYYQRFDLAQLIDPHFGYFNANKKDSIYYHSDKYKRFASHKIYGENIKAGDTVIDLASGRGADVFKLKELGVSRLVAIDKDIDAISELIQRKYTYTGIGSKKPMLIYTIVKDLNSPSAEIIQEINKFNVLDGDIVICNFAIHYFCDTVQHIKLFISLVAKLLKAGGLFIFITLDGEQIFNKLAGLKFGESWKLIEGDIDKYTYTKKYNSNKFENVSQFINVKMPFSTINYDEPLANLKYIISICEKHNMKLEFNEPIIEYIDEYVNMDKITIVDKTILNMTNYVVLRKIK